MRRGERSRTLGGLALTALALASLAAGCGAIAGCGASRGAVGAGSASTSARTGGGPASDPSGKRWAPARSAARSGGPIATLTATPARAKVGSTVRFEVTASVPHALGALGYRIDYGDGTSAENAVPQFCIAGRRTPARRAWPLFHRYDAAGRYRVSGRVYVNCSDQQATATVEVRVG